MELTQEQQKARELINSVIAKAWEDADFKNQLITNPTAAIEKLTGKSFNMGTDAKKIVIADQTDPNTVYITIPPKPVLEDVELSEDQLELVSGGTDFLDDPLAWGIENISIPAALWIVDKLS